MKRRAVIVGVNRYRHPDINDLRFAVHDAARVKNFLETLPHGSRFERIRFLVEPLDTDVFEAVEECREGLEPGDLFLFYFSGHGVRQEGNGPFLMLCPHALPGVLRSGTNSTIPHSFLDTVAIESECDCFYILDACRSSFLRSRGDAGVMDGSVMLRDMGALKQTAGRGVCVKLWSCNDGEQSRESSDLEGGLFTVSLVQAMRASLQETGGLAVNESLLRRSLDEMKRLSGGMLFQRPEHSAVPGGCELVIVPPMSAVHFSEHEHAEQHRRTERVFVFEPPALFIETDPQDSRVLINGLDYGRSPVSVHLSAGNVRVRVERDGFVPREETVWFDGAADIRLRFHLVKAPETVRTEPPAQEIVRPAPAGDTPTPVRVPEMPSTPQESRKIRAVGFHIACPHCSKSFYTEVRDGEVTCSECDERFTLDRNGKPVGRDVECPYCKDSFYTEETDVEVNCPNCNKSFSLDEDGDLVGQQVPCPYCEEPFYTEETDTEVTCPNCNESFTLDEAGAPVGRQIACPHCDASFYTEKKDTDLFCVECNRIFTLDESYEPIGSRVECPHCTETFYADYTDGEIECTECEGKFRLNESGLPSGTGIECPYCKESFYTEEADSELSCPNCDKSFSLDEDGGLVGQQVECPHCEETFYTEENDTEVTCSECDKSFTIDENGQPVGRTLECPHCKENFYTDDTEQEVTCTECGGSFSVGEFDQPMGQDVECPYCTESFYTEEKDAMVSCPSCDRSFTLDEDGAPVGEEVVCPYCEEPFYTEETEGEVSCEECGESFNIEEC